MTFPSSGVAKKLDWRFRKEKQLSPNLNDVSRSVQLVPKSGNKKGFVDWKEGEREQNFQA